MSESTSGIRNTIVSWLSSLLVLSVLAAIGWWGHANHWQFSHSKHASSAVETSAGHSLPDPAQSAEERPEIRPVAGELPEIAFSSAAGAKMVGIETSPVILKTMNEEIFANGTVEYDQTKVAQLSLRVGGTVWRVEKRLGDEVTRGEPLAIIDSAAVGEAKADLLEACVVYRLKSQHLARISQIKDAIAGREIIEVEAATELARTQRSTALQKLINLGFRLSPKELESLSPEELGNRLHVLGLPESLHEETMSNNQIPLVAPFSGIVTKCDIVQGESIEPARPFYVVADTSQMWIQLNVRQDDANRLKLGTPVRFISDMQAVPVTGTLTWIGTAIDPRTRTVQARAQVDNPLREENGTGRRLAAGTFGTARILLESRSGALAIPDNALHWQWEIGEEVVFVAEEEGKTFRPQIVEKGLLRDGYVQILQGLQTGARVVTSGSRVLAAELSEHLQAEVGENADAVRTFHHAHDDHSNGG